MAVTLREKMREAGYISSTEAARRLSVNPSTTNRWFHAGKVTGRRVGIPGGSRGGPASARPSLYLEVASLIVFVEAQWGAEMAAEFAQGLETPAEVRDG